VLFPSNPYQWEVGVAYSRAFNDRLFAGLDGRYSKGRGDRPDVTNLRGTLGWRLSERVTLDFSSRYERDETGSRFSGLFSISVRMGRNGFVRGDYDTRFDRTRLAYNQFGGHGVGAYQLSADVERNRFGGGANLVSTYFANRAELGFSHFGTFTRGFDTSLAQRSSLRVATSIAMADGAFSIGRPIFDSFAIVRGHRSLKGSEIVIDPGSLGNTTFSGVLGAATHPNLGSYTERNITIDAPSAPAGVDLGQGSFRLLPPYRSGYLLTVGSDYNVSVLGRLVGQDGEPISLVSGQAVEVAQPQKEPITFFTNREGRFGLTGLAPGKWRLKLLGEEELEITIDIAADAEGVVRLNDLKPQGVK
jgi:outer membrane usher protein